MFNGKASKTISHNGKEYNVTALATAIATGPKVELDPKIKFHQQSFDQAQIPQEWKDKYKGSVLTLIEGQYVYILKSEEIHSVKEIRFVSKFALNKARVVEAPMVDVNKPIYESTPLPVQRPFNPPRFSNTKPASNGFVPKKKY